MADADQKGNTEERCLNSGRWEVSVTLAKHQPASRPRRLRADCQTKRTPARLRADCQTKRTPYGTELTVKQQKAGGYPVRADLYSTVRRVDVARC